MGEEQSGCALSKVARWQGAACWAREWPAQAWALFAGICSLLSGRQVTWVIFRFKPSYRTTGEIYHLAETPRQTAVTWAELQVGAQRAKLLSGPKERLLPCPVQELGCLLASEA